MKPLTAVTDLPSIGADDCLHLGPLDVHIWHYTIGSDQSLNRLKTFLGLLSPEERDRYAKMGQAGRQRQFLATRVLCRWVLSRYSPVEPADWRFQLDRRGKPSIAAPSVSPPLWFSLSHTPDVSVCVVSRAGPNIGVDIEKIDPSSDCREVAAQFFPDIETSALRRLSQTLREEDFIRRWALKESFVKASGVGLDQGLAGTAFSFSPSGTIGVTFVAPLDESPARWSFYLLRLDQDLILALSVRLDAAGPLRLHAATGFPQKEWRPLGTTHRDRRRLS